MGQKYDLTNETIEKWYVIGRNAIKPGYWDCICECGTQRTMRTNRLISGESKGCHKCSNQTHGCSTNGTRTKEREAWKTIKQRCNNPMATGYEYYGLMGRYICDRYQDSFIAFLNDVGEAPTPQHTIDRIDNTGNYTCGKCPSCIEKGDTFNICWSTMEEQNKNRKGVELYLFEGKLLCLTDIAKLANMSRDTLRSRVIIQGLSLEEALTREKWYDRRDKTTKEETKDLLDSFPWNKITSC